MNPSDQVVSLELSKRLKELGVKQKSLFYWVDLIEPYIVPVITNSDKKIFTALTHDILPPTVFSAFTVAELGEMIPEWFDSLKRLSNDWVCRFYEKNGDIYHHSFDQTEANARAKMLIYLYEQGLIKND
jgi:hypothetical protein